MLRYWYWYWNQVRMSRNLLLAYMESWHLNLLIKLTDYTCILVRFIDNQATAGSSAHHNQSHTCHYKAKHQNKELGAMVSCNVRLTALVTGFSVAPRVQSAFQPAELSLLSP